MRGVSSVEHVGVGRRGCPGGGSGAIGDGDDIGDEMGSDGASVFGDCVGISDGR